MMSKKMLSFDEYFEILLGAVRTLSHSKRKLLLSLITAKQLKAKFNVSKIVSKK